MSFLADIHSYIASNSTITAVLPASKVYTGIIPEGFSFPYAVITSIGLSPTFLTGSGYYGEFSFQISVFDSDHDNVESLCNTIAGQFDYQSISASTIACIRTNGPILLLDQDTPERVYHGMIEYRLSENKSMPGA